ncbi:MAG: hypothetical protein IKQ45_04565 [Clostridia bacterium]|nr:hypothetical protein [Clostridia bacterium]
MNPVVYSPVIFTDSRDTVLWGKAEAEVEDILRFPYNSEWKGSVICILLSVAFARYAGMMRD